MAQVFISHAHVEEALARKVAELICNALGLTTADFFLSSQEGHGVAPSASIRESIAHELQSVPALVVLLTPKSAASPWVWLEAGGRLGSADKTAPIFIVPSGRFMPLLAPVADLRCLQMDNDGELHELVQAVGKILGRTPLDFLNYKPALEDVVQSSAQEYSLAAERRGRAVSWVKGHFVALVMVAASLGVLAYSGRLASVNRVGEAAGTSEREAEARSQEATFVMNDQAARTAQKYLKLRGKVTSASGAVHGASVMVSRNEVKDSSACQEPDCTKDSTTSEGEFMIDLTKIQADSGERVILSVATNGFRPFSKALEVDVRATDQGTAPQIVTLVTQPRP